MTVLLSGITAADQLVNRLALETAYFNLNQISLHEQSTNVYFAVRCTAVLHLYLCLHAIFSLACMLA